MKFPAESLAVLASSQPKGNEGFNVRHLSVANANANANERTTGTLKKGDSLSQVTSTIVEKLRNLQDVEECDPDVELQEQRRLQNHHGHFDIHSETSSILDSEFGILSPTCGVGRMCDDGLCVDIEDEDWGERRSLQVFPNSTYGGEIPFNLAIDALKYVCEVGGLVGYDCTCNLDEEAYTGDISCLTPLQCRNQTSVCGAQVEDCYQTTHSFILMGTPGVLDGVYCKQFLTPFEQTACYETSTEDYGENILPECTLTLDGEECSYCAVYKYGEQECFTFDCSNTALSGNGRGARVGNTCSVPAHTMGLYLDTFSCPSCDLCGDVLDMTAPSSTVELFNKTYYCSYVQDVALAGYFTAESCAYFSSLTQGPCGCAEPSTSTPTSIVIENVFTCEICPDGVVSPDAMVSIPGSSATSCADIETAGRDGSIVGEELCVAVKDLAAETCCGVVAPSIETEDVVTADDSEDTSCTICGPGLIHTKPVETLVSVPTQGIYTCGELIDLGKNGTLDENGICLLVQLSANTPCGCVAEGPTVAPSTVPVGDAYDVPAPSSTARTSLAAVAVAMVVGGTTMLSYFLC